jgi:hypothetical protein
MTGATVEQKQAVRTKLDSCSHYIGRRTVTFHWEDKDGIPWQNGTGVLLRIAHRVFVITAAHVADEIKAKHDAQEPTFIIGGGMYERRPVPLDRVALISSPMAGKNRQWNDLYDIAAVELSPLAIKELEAHSTFLELQQLDLTVGQHDGGYFYIVGFTAASNQADHKRRILTTTTFPILTQLFRRDLNELVVFDPAIGLVFNFDAHAGKREGSPRVAPRLGGISGCGIWRVVSANMQFMECDPADSKLVAIEHKEVGSSKAIVGTRIKFALQMIFRDYPDLREALTSVFPSLE